MKKILIVINSLNGGGAEKVLYDVLKNISSNNKVDIFLLINEGIYLKKIFQNLKEEVNIIYLCQKKAKIKKFFILRKLDTFLKKIKIKIYCKYPFLIKKLKNKNYDMEIAFLEGYSTVLVANRKNNSKKIAWVHTDLLNHRVINKKLEKKSYEKMDKVICVSEDSKKSLLKLYPKLENKIQVIHNPIDQNDILEKSNEKLNFNKKKLNIVAIGRLTKIKGYDILLQAHNRLIKEGLNYTLMILGEGEERKNLEKYIKENNLENNTELLGFKENPYPYLKEADIFVSSSRYEGYPLVLCEAICLGKPIIATKCTGPKEILENEKYGLMAEVENVDDLAEKIKKLVSNEELRRKYSELSKERAKIFNIKKTLEEIESLFY